LKVEGYRLQVAGCRLQVEGEREFGVRSSGGAREMVYGGWLMVDEGWLNGRGAREMVKLEGGVSR
jgi:hypothetical protein